MMTLKVVLTVPSAVTATMITTEMSAAMSPYSMAVAPNSSCKNDTRGCKCGLRLRRARGREGGMID